MSIFPFMRAEDSEAKTEELPMFTEYAYDYKQNRLCKDSEGKSYLVTGNEALKIWIYKALSTARYRYAAYSDDYGSELDDLIGTARAEEVIKLELQRMITEALLINPYINSVSNFSISRSMSGTSVMFDVVTIYSPMQINMEGADI